MQHLVSFFGGRYKDSKPQDNIAGNENNNDTQNNNDYQFTEQRFETVNDQSVIMNQTQNLSFKSFNSEEDVDVPSGEDNRLVVTMGNVNSARKQDKDE